MRDILERCIRLDTLARDSYREMARACDDVAIAAELDGLADDREEHVDWWTRILTAWDEGLIPDIANEHDLASELELIERSVAEVLPASFDSCTCDEMLETAARVEYLLLNPFFGELAELMGPGSHSDRWSAYSRHIRRLMNAIDRFHAPDATARFYSRMLARASRDVERFITLSMRDELTGLYNRRGVLSHLEQWLAWAARYGRPLSIVLIDVDDFQRINDRFGHRQGDEALAAIAGIVRAAARSSDIVGRFGGDEFLVVAPETGGPELVRLMQRLREHLHRSPLALSGTPVPVSASIGGAWVGGGTSIEPETLLAAADRSLYEAKESGRDRCGEPRQAFAALV